MSYKKEVAEKTRLLIADGWTPMGNSLFYKDDLVNTTSPYGLPLKIDLPGVNAPDWIEEEGEPDEQ